MEKETGNETICFYDSPAENDQLNIKPICEGLVNLIKRARKPFILALIGEWGSGKTTLINHSLDEIKGEYAIATFNAWAHSKGMPLLKALFSHLSTRKETVWEGAKEDFKELAKSPISSAAIRGVGSFGGPIGAIFAEIAVKGLETLEKTGEKKNQDDDVEALIQEFKKIATEFNSREKPLLIFIDDLDRCTPTEALDFIDDIKIYLTVDAPVVFIVAIDRRTLSMGIKGKYGYDSEVTVDEYLDKIFSYAVYMPKFSELELLIDSALQDVPVKADSHDLAKIAKDFIKVFEIKNLRSIKRIIRKWGFIIPHDVFNYLNEAKVPNQVEADKDNLARFALILSAMSELYPEHFEALSSREAMHHEIARFLVHGPPSEFPKDIVKGYLRFIGFHGDTDKEAERII